jgi:hypothetical protein
LRLNVNWILAAINEHPKFHQTEVNHETVAGLQEGRPAQELGGQLRPGYQLGFGFRGGSENYFGIKIEADDHNVALEFDVDESPRIKQQLDKFLLYIDRGRHRWEPGNYFKNLKRKSEQQGHSDRDQKAE